MTLNIDIECINGKYKLLNFIFFNKNDQISIIVRLGQKVVFATTIAGGF